MNKLRLCLLAMVLAVVMVGCEQGQAVPAEFNLNEVFTLGGGQEAVMTDENLRLRFEEVLEDSRCPTQVNCVWTGQARIAVVVQAGEEELVTVEFNTNPAAGQNVQTAEVGEYTIELQSLDPYPETLDAIQFKAYQATLIVRKGDANPALQFNLNEPFTLNGGQEATITSENLHLRFDEVLDDSRCPRQVNCAEAGQARIAVIVQEGEGEPVTVVFNTNPAPSLNVQQVEVGAYSIELRSLDPYPETPGVIEFEAYQATLVVRKENSPTEANVDEPFTLNGGQEATISGENLRVRFTEVLEDSRCPTEVTCVWAGTARVALVVQVGDGEAVTVEVNSNPEAGKPTAEVEEYTIELQSLAPQPETPGEAIPLAGYQATLVVTKGNPPIGAMQFNLEESFTLNGGQEAEIQGENLSLRFAEVLEDSRCPRQVECEWAGQARIALEVQQGEADPVTVELNTYAYEGQQTAEVGDYTIQLRAIDPYPETPGETITFETYRATLVVWKERPVQYGLGEAFTVAGGEEVVIMEENLHLRFEAVLEDSRCPTEVECFWTGQARIVVVVQEEDGEPVEVEFNTNPAPDQNVQTAEVGAYHIRLELLAPYPARPAEVIEFEAYRATLVVTR
jgi:hypothetical protein